MKKAMLVCAIVLIIFQSYAQEKTYLVFEFMKVDESQNSAYWETESFWSKIHEQRAKSGAIQGWDLWSLSPGAEEQGYQFVTVQIYNDPVKMMSGGSFDDLMANAKKAYPDMSEGDIMSKINKSSETRDLAVRVFMEVVDGTTPQYDMKVGMVTTIDIMKVELGNYQAYEKAEAETFKPQHQAMVDAGAKGSWSLARVMSPIGSDAYGSHMTFNFFNDWKHFFDAGNYDGGTPSDAEIKKVQEGLALRDMKWVYLAELQMMARP